MHQDNLYNHPDKYSNLFGYDDEDLSFYREVIPDGVTCDAVLDLGSGNSDLLQHVLERRRSQFCIHFDLSRHLLLASPAMTKVQGDINDLCFRENAFDLVFSRLLSVSYALGAVSKSHSEARIESLFHELKSVGRKGCLYILELPIVYKLNRLQGVEESLQLGAQRSYRFTYLDLEYENTFGGKLYSRIAYGDRGNEYHIDDPLFVFHPEKLKALLERTGFTEVFFYAPGDSQTKSELPPANVMRSVITFRK